MPDLKTNQIQSDSFVGQLKGKMEGIPWEQAVVKDEREQGRWKIWTRWSRKQKAPLGTTEGREGEDLDRRNTPLHFR
ncbi:hypothetical protein SLA2020_525230 [Shorea laevis]